MIMKCAKIMLNMLPIEGA